MDSEFWQDAEHRVERAKDLLRRRQWPAALEELRAAAEIDPTNPVHHYELGRCLELLGRDDEATDAFGRAADLDASEPAYLCAYGTGLLSQQLWREAAEVFGEAESLDPSHEPAYVNRILAYTELGDHDRAEQMFYLAQQLREDSPEAFYNIG
ncbi:MAG: tetratricopeptide repeat protein, partial [Planctomycetota bacterium]